MYNLTYFALIITSLKYARKNNVRSGIRTHASIRRPERPPPLLNGKVYDHLESGALDRSAILTSAIIIFLQYLNTFFFYFIFLLTTDHLLASRLSLTL